MLVCGVPKRIDRDQRKAELAEAVWHVAQQRGIGAVSVRAVAEQAGVVVGSLRHVFPTRAELLLFSAELMVARATDRVLAVPRSEDPQAYALEVLRQLLPLAPDSRTELEVNLALIAEAPAEPGLAGIRDHAHRQLEEACVQLVQLVSGRERAAPVVQRGRRLHALVDGLAVHLLVQPPAESGEWALDIVREELAGLAAWKP